MENEAKEFDEIWMFIEEKLNVLIPNYFKNILQACWYDNGISIAQVEESDLSYFVEEVKNGNVSKYFQGKDERNILDGCTKTVGTFEFTRGHSRFLMSIVNYLQIHIQDNGPATFTLQKPPKTIESKRKRPALTPVVPRTKMKYSAFTVTNNQQSARERPVEPSISIENSGVLLSENLKKQRAILLRKTIKSLITHTSEMYVENFEKIHTKVLTDLVTVEINNPSNVSLVDGPVTYAAGISCPFCLKIIHVSQSSVECSNGRSGEPWWNTSNLDRHFKIHQNSLNFEGEENIGNIDMNLEQSARPPSADRHSMETEKHIMPISGSSGMLQKFVNSAERNFDRKKPGYRYDMITKMFAAFIKMLAGLFAYEILHANFPLSLPSVSTVNRFLYDDGPEIIEGQLRTTELLKYLKSRNLPMSVSLSEDATRITAKVSYDPNTNQLVGFALPLDSNGMPIPLSFDARNVNEIQKHFSNPSNVISSNVYVQMAQPLDYNSSPFCLMIFLTDNTFTAQNIRKRWEFTSKHLKEKGIEIHNISTDGDARPLRIMKILSKIGISDPLFLDCEWFSCGGQTQTTFTQDTTHIVTKLRNRLLKASRLYPIGNRVISSSHLKYLIENVSKDKHLMTRYDIEPKDRQNFDTAEKICSEKTIFCLLEHVPGSEGTAIYLRAMNYVLSAFLDTQITSKLRIYKIWYAVFFFRIWRSWLLNSEKIKNKKTVKRLYNLKQNFISTNCYDFIELNAHSIVKQFLELEEMECSRNDGEKDDQVFFPNLYGSQPCESNFRQIRLFSSTYASKVNCSMLDIIHRIKKIELQNDIIHNSNGQIKFPRFEKKVSASIANQKNNRVENLSGAEIIFEIERAKTDLNSDIAKLNIDTSNLNFRCQVTVPSDLRSDDNVEIDSDGNSDVESDFDETELRTETQADNLEDEQNDIEFEEISADIPYLSGVTDDLRLKDYSGRITSLDDKSPFVVVSDSKGNEVVVRKSSVCWFLSKNKCKLSSDRLQRVQEKDYIPDHSASNKSDVEDYTVNNEIRIGEWCLFFLTVEKERSRKALLGLVLGFTYLSGLTFKAREYSQSFVSVKSNNEKGVGILCSFYNFNAEGMLMSIPGVKHEFVEVQRYVCTIRNPFYKNCTPKIPEQLVIKLLELISMKLSV